MGFFYGFPQAPFPCVIGVSQLRLLGKFTGAGKGGMQSGAKEGIMGRVTENFAAVCQSAFFEKDLGIGIGCPRERSRGAGLKALV
ncbi:MAG: hypothetical protein BWY75_03643 [bacterium ADurb.Bin425]|nr:MAG: hypothetical protein BWY75_03643 [bacterium ADurb.Bin425]